VDRTKEIYRLLPAVIALNADLVVTHWSHGAESLFGLASEETVGAAVTKLESWHVEDATLRSYQQIPIGGSRSYRKQVVTRRGVHLTMDSIASASLDSNGAREVLICFGLTPGSRRPSTAQPSTAQPSIAQRSARQRSAPKRSAAQASADYRAAATNRHHFPSPRRMLARILPHT
jgi:PAS domain-containing protein